jgi:hypothetical protein
MRPKDIQCFCFKCMCAVAWWRFDRRSVITPNKNVSIQFILIYSVHFVKCLTLCMSNSVYNLHKDTKNSVYKPYKYSKPQFTIHIYTLKTQNTSTSTIKYNTLYNTALISTLIKMDNDDQ